MIHPATSLPRVTEMVHELVSRRLRPGHAAVDATVGNGHDTLFLARCVGPGGRVEGFDIQPEAIAAARSRTAGLPQVRLHCRGHEHMGEIAAGPVEAVLFNLGYLPSGDKRVITRSDTTLAALDAALGLLSPSGLLSVVVYPGHPGGGEESDAVEAWFRGRARSLRVVRYGPLLQEASPQLFAAECRRSRPVGPDRGAPSSSEAT